MIAALCLSLSLCATPAPALPPEPVLVSAAEQATARALWHEVGRARLIVAWADSLETELEGSPALEPEATAARRPPPGTSGPVAGTGTVNGYPCGGNLPPCSVLACESGGNPTADNPRSSASGLWQIISSTWDYHAGYPTAASAPVEVQNEKAAQLFAGGAGIGHWAQCR